MGLFGSKKKEETAPPQPPAPPSPQPSQEPSSMDDEISSLPAPPVPGASGNFDEIKTQVKGNSEDDDKMSNGLESSSEENSNTVDSLFDFSDFELPGVDSSNSKSSSKFSSGHTESKALTHTKFRRHDPSIASSETFFITTAQFKHFLDTVETVRKKVKDASERHLRLLDIKGEEDVEFENLRKDFQHIEDKLYEIDSSIFER